MRSGRLLRIAVAIGLTAYVVWRSDVAAIVRVSASARLDWIAYAVALVVIDRALNAYRWLLLLAALTPGSRPPAGAVMRIFFVSSFVGSFLPNPGGDVYRAYELSKLRVQPAEAAVSVLIDRLLGVLSMILVAGASLVFARRFDLPGAVPVVVLGLALGMIAAAGVFSERAASAAVALTARVPWPRLSRLARALTGAMRRYADHHGALQAVLTLSVGVQILRILQAYCLGRSLSMTTSIGVYFLLIPLITLIMQIPVTVGGLGTTQFAFERLFGQAGVPAPQAVVLSILFLALGTLGNLPGGLIYLLGRRPKP